MKKVHHIVLLTFKANPDETACAVFAALDGLRHKLPGILHFTHGPYASPEGLNQGFTHGFIMTFADATARDHYLTHPEHEKVKVQFLPGVANVVAFDFEENA